MAIERPLDLLNASKGKQVILQIEDGRQFTGQLVCFDIHVNLVLDNVSEIGRSGETVTGLGIVFFRGDTVILVSPAK